MKSRVSRFAAVMLFCALIAPASSRAQSGETWSFGVSGDSRNCGDIVMPGIAAGVRADHARFYWHLGDYRVTTDFDQDLAAASQNLGQHLAIADYERLEWQDFIEQQLASFGDTPVYLAIGNHELAPPKTRADFLQQFADWLDSDTVRAQRLRDNPKDHKLRTYYHWNEGGVDFISMDNASPEMFDDGQMAWFESVLARDETDGTIRTVVVGMHDALPDSVSAGHSMDESAQMERSGRHAYQDLVAFRAKTKKFVYALASHSHFMVEDPYNDMCHTTPDTVLPGWIVGTAGAVRYRLPTNLGGAKQAKTDVYGYLLGTVLPTGEIRFVFKEVTREKIPPNTVERYGSKQVEACFVENKSPFTPAGPSCPSPNPGTP